jgi:hypothetical protein
MMRAQISDSTCVVMLGSCGWRQASLRRRDGVNSPMAGAM